jgi:hypothetical protein
MGQGCFLLVDDMKIRINGSEIQKGKKAEKEEFTRLL